MCGANGSIDPLDKHHIFGASNRNNSEKYGLFVWICHTRCHIFGVNAVHRNKAQDNELKAFAQRKAMEHYKWSKDDFRAVFGKNYID